MFPLPVLQSRSIFLKDLGNISLKCHQKRIPDTPSLHLSTSLTLMGVLLQIGKTTCYWWGKKTFPFLWIKPVSKHRWPMSFLSLLSFKALLLFVSVRLSSDLNLTSFILTVTQEKNVLCLFNFLYCNFCFDTITVGKTHDKINIYILTLESSLLKGLILYKYSKLQDRREDDQVCYFIFFEIRNWASKYSLVSSCLTSDEKSCPGRKQISHFNFGIKILHLFIKVGKVKIWK